MLSEEIEQCRLQCRHRMNGDAPVECLCAAAANVAGHETLAHLVQYCIPGADRTPFD
jgi:hypothetical protein